MSPALLRARSEISPYQHHSSPFHVGLPSDACTRAAEKKGKEKTVGQEISAALFRA